MPRPYTDRVFINCPFDEEYRPLFPALVFVVHACGMTARTALEADNGAEVRIEKIVRIIRECCHSVHDISRVELDADSGLPRMNMPFEPVVCRPPGMDPDDLSDRDLSSLIGEWLETETAALPRAA